MAKKKSIPRKSLDIDPLERFRQRTVRPSKKQQEYLEILLNDCGFSTRVQRNSYLGSETGREITFLDDLTIGEAAKIIGILKARRDASKPRGHGFNEEYEEDERGLEGLGLEEE